MTATITEPLGEAPRMNAILELVSRTSPAAMVRLEAAFPDQVQELRPGLKLGGSSTRKRELMLAVAGEGIVTAAEQIAALLRIVPRRLARVRRWKLWAAILSAMSSAGVISAATMGARLATVAGSCVTLAANLAGLVAQHNDTPLFGESAGLASVAEAMLLAESKITTLKVELVSLKATPGADPAELIKEVNAICAAVRRAQLQCKLG
jgi:hypothetical protein